MRIPLPTDVILLQCENCQTNLPLNKGGLLTVGEQLQQDIDKVIEEMQKSLIDVHIKQSEECARSMVKINPVVGTPQNLCLFFPESDMKYIKDFQLAGDCFNANIQVSPTSSDCSAIFVLYQNENNTERTYSEFISCNFDTFLNTELPEPDECTEDDLIHDDESAMCFQQMLPRMTGGGKRIGSDFNYICIWCSKKDVERGTKGRFKELKNYRDHFKKYHHGEDGNGVPMSEFLKKVNRCEPTWFCIICKQHLSLGNQVRHEAICQQEQISDTSDSESDSGGEGTKQKAIDQQRNKNKKPVFHMEPRIQIQSEQDRSNHQASGRTSKDIDVNSIQLIEQRQPAASGSCEYHTGSDGEIVEKRLTAQRGISNETVFPQKQSGIHSTEETINPQASVNKDQDCDHIILQTGKKQSLSSGSCQHYTGGGDEGIEKNTNDQYGEANENIFLQSQPLIKTREESTNQQASVRKEQETEENIFVNLRRTNHSQNKLAGRKGSCAEGNESYGNVEQIQQKQLKRANIDASVLTEDNNNSVSKHKKKVKLVEIAEVDDEVYLSADQQEDSDTELCIKVEMIDDTEKPREDSFIQKQNINKWWLSIQKHLYTDRGLGGPKIFKTSDSEEFVKRVSENYQKHLSEKRDLDRRRQIHESGDARFCQFSLERDQPFLDKYKDFVQSSSAKDVMHIFSEDYEELDIPMGAKSSTALQYTHRILEFFNFMAKIYKNFHLDWMLDFKCQIQKIQPDKSVSCEIFLPIKTDLTSFVKKFKYGSNPAANCGVRIFALKKLMDFLALEMKDNEHAFTGNIVEKSAKVECLVQKIKNLNLSICPDGTIKHLATASNKSHRKTLIEQMARCPERNMDTIMKGVSEYVQSDDFFVQRTKLIELACKKTKIPTSQEYMNSTNWLLEQLICIGGNRPCALLGITLKDWEERKPGYCPFYQHEDNALITEDPENDKRKILQNPYTKPKGIASEETTGFIVKSDTDKIAVGPPCYIWFPNALVDLVNNHSLIAQKIIPRSVDIYHPNTRLFLNSNGKQIKSIDCKHFKNYLGIPITAYDFRRSLSTFCLDSKVDAVRAAESSVLRHREKTGFAYYYQKHSEKVEYVSIQYAMQHGLLKAETSSIDEYCKSLRKKAANDEWELTQKRTDKALEHSQDIMKKRKQTLNDAREKGGRYWILPAEFESFIEGIEEAIKLEGNRVKAKVEPGPFSQLLKYKPGAEGAGAFPPPSIWLIDMYRVLFGLEGIKGDAMRKADLSVYDGEAFSSGPSGRKKIETIREKSDGETVDEDLIVATYWRVKIKNEAKQRAKGKWVPLRFIFTDNDLAYHTEQVKVKKENE